ncbi:MAG: bacillithiol biosynthesis deacetylase BshB1 [Flammeovirgaceae bacterium]|jgi:bacillithiol biosynthesis deacetylase BshB1|nr:bacillithiol biosynthesis deacetylase BshB1 [Flammeovirgaceae bacterium]
MKLDILAISAHPDDIELSCSGTLIAHKSQGYTTGILDLTEGEMSTRGTPATRQKESAEASEIMGLSMRENLGLSDAKFDLSFENQLRVIKVLRKFRPEIILANALYDRHPDHVRAAELIEEAVFKSGLVKIETEDEKRIQSPWRPKKVYHYIQSVSLEPDFICDITAHMEEKMAAIRVFKSQFFDPKSKEPDTYISNPDFLKLIEARSREWGHRIGVSFGEGFVQRQSLGVKNLFDLV